MDGKDLAIDNIFTERFWRSLKYEEVYLREYRTGHEAWHGIDRYMKFYSERRPNSMLQGKYPVPVFKGKLKAPAIVRTAKV